MGKDVMIPLALLNRLVDLIEYLDVSNYDAAIRLEHWELLKRLRDKQHKRELRDGCAKTTNAKNQPDRDEARINYLEYKSWLRDVANSEDY